MLFTRSILKIGYNNVCIVTSVISMAGIVVLRSRQYLLGWEQGKLLGRPIYGVSRCLPHEEHMR